MAIVLNGTTHQLRSADFGTSRPAAFSCACWFRADAAPASTYEQILTVGTTATYPNNKGDMFLRWGDPTAGDRRKYIQHTTSTNYILSTAASSGAWPATTWCHAVCVSTGSTMVLYANGTATASPVTANVTASAPSNWHVAVGSGVPFDSRWAGKVCMVTYWDAALSADDVIGLGKGSTPLRIRPQSLRYFVPGVRTSEAVVGATATAANLTYDGDMPRLYL